MGPNTRNACHAGAIAEAVDSDDEGYGHPKRQRMIWSEELHRCFVAAFYELGSDAAVPNRILKVWPPPHCVATIAKCTFMSKQISRGRDLQNCGTFGGRLDYQVLFCTM